MSGRDLRNFVVHHRSDDIDRLVRRVTEGLPHTGKYKQVDYEELKRIAAEKRFQGQEKLVKVKKIQEASKQGKERQLLDQHKAVWQREFLRLNAQRKPNQTDIEQHIFANKKDDDNFMIYTEIDEYGDHVDHDFQQFKKNTADPLWMLREDLQYWVQQYMNSGGVIPGEHPDKVKGQIERVKGQQKQILEKLRNEEISIEQELAAVELPDVLSLSQKKLPRVETGIPEEAFNLECPDLNLKAQVLQEFILIDDKYSEKLDEIEEKHAAALGSRTGGWSDTDQFTFQYVMDQYPYNLHNRRTLYMDRLKKHLPHKTRAELVEHEDWWYLHKHLQDRLRALLNDWSRDRVELLCRAKLVFHEACLHAEQEQEKHAAKSSQQQLCQELYERVAQWREQKLEVMRLEAEMAEKDRKIYLQKLQEEEEEEKRRRDRKKKQVGDFHEKKRAEVERKAEIERKRLEYMKQQLAEQAERDRERVNFRDEEYQRKQFEKREKEEERVREEEEKERVLEAIRMQVRPHVEADLLRVWSDTAATKEHRRKDENYINIQQPLYGVSGYTGKQVMSDPRVRLENELRDAGLIHNDYARQMVHKMAPPQAPRKDMESKVFR